MFILTKLFPIMMGSFLCMVLINFGEVGDYPQKIWLHRCNSLEKLYEKQELYPNIEVDVIFRENQKFDVTHDIDTSFGLYLESYFSYLETEKGKMWLDIKNMNLHNAAAMLTMLDELTEHYHVSKDRLIIESTCWEALEDFTHDGYYTSFYVPYDSPCSLEKEEIEECIEQLQKISDEQAVCALSFPGVWYSTLKEELDRPIDLLSWQHRTTQLGLLLSPKGRRMLFDPQLKVILVKSKGKYHR